jgi:CubicO group peptidase (beta-lactamase class C family)
MDSNSNVDDVFAALEKAFSEAVRDGVLPGAVLTATNGNGSFHYAKAFGNNGFTGDPLTTKSIMAIASMTKLLTSIAALQLVERQLVHLDQDISPLIPTLAAQEVLTGWDTTGRYITQKRENAITLRYLLTHSSGAGYDMSNPALARVTMSRGREINVGATVNERFGYPLLFEPGTSWEYGTGIDWVGQLVERLTGQELESYMQEHIWNPLAIQRITFWPSRRIDMDAERMRITVRDENSGRAVPLQRPFLTEGVSECFGGQGAYAAMEDFMKVLRSILADDGKLLTKDTTATMFQSQLGDASRESLRKHIKSCGLNAAFIGISDNSHAYDWGIGGMLAMDDVSSGRKKGTLFWSGKPNLFWVSRKQMT